MKIIWDDEAWDDYLYWQGQDKKTLKRVNRLVQDISRNGHDGIGKPNAIRAQAAGMIYKLLNFLGKQTGLQFICLKMQGSLGDPGAAFRLSSGYVYPMRPSSRCW
jgi:toxin YoeB